ncbi:MAG: hypothetical protein M1372_01040 [Patescibacteria group bacterium]|nr:hypothetical protein [Patescibacteria group bacterium]
MIKIKSLFKFELILIVLALTYYLIFANKGLVFLDEGYFLHSAERIFNGQVPYRNFSLQYGPTFFYILAFLFKAFGPSILIGRLFTVFICVLIIAIAFWNLNKLKVSLDVIIISFLSLVSFGYPLINIPNIMWANVLLAFLLVLTYIYWLPQGRYRYIVAIGIFLALSLSFKQNFGVAFIILFNFLLFWGRKESLQQKMKNFLILQEIWISTTLIWVYYFFLRNNIQGLFDFINFSKRFTQTIVFSYPPINFIFKPTGIFKLLPYYLPVLLLFTVLIMWFKRDKDFKIIAFSSTAVIGFFVSIYPQSDLLHSYPFLGMVLISFLLLPIKKKKQFFLRITVAVMVLMGFYLTLFTKSYRYENYYYRYDTYLDLPRTQGIMITKKDSKDIIKVAKFIESETKKDDYIFAYPYSPLFYFILNRPNPSRDALYFLPNWHFYDDETIIAELEQKKVKYVITQGNYILDTDLSRFIQKQKKIFTAGQFEVFKIIYQNKIYSENNGY